MRKRFAGGLAARLVSCHNIAPDRAGSCGPYSLGHHPRRDQSVLLEVLRVLILLLRLIARGLLELNFLYAPMGSRSGRRGRLIVTSHAAVTGAATT
jgi:hypothetical protein